ncbi:MAG: hypothetical protein ACE366_14110 [Bradymonadia bacterium]
MLYLSVHRLMCHLALTGLLLGCDTSSDPQRVPTLVDASPPEDGSPAEHDAATSTPEVRDTPLMFFVGQNTPDLSAFRTEVLNADADFPEPDGITLYTNIVPGTCSGTTDGPCDINGTINDFEASLAEYPDAALAVGLYLSDSHAECNDQTLRALTGRADPDLAAGLGEDYRQSLDALIAYLQGTGRDVYLRIGYEFDGPWNCYDKDLYIEAFQVVKSRIDALGAESIQTVWQSAAYPRSGDARRHYDPGLADHLDQWYPGDAFVDWVAISAFTWAPAHLEGPWRCSTPNLQPATLYAQAAEFAAAHDKPLMIAEAAPAGYRTDNGAGQSDVRCITGELGERPLSEDDLWSAWYAPVFDFARSTPQLGILAYINSDWQAFPQFACAPGASGGTAECPNGYWGNSRIQDAPSIQSRFAAEISWLTSP